MTRTDRRREAAGEKNKADMIAAVRRWIFEGLERPDGARLLEAKAQWVEAQLQTLSKTAELNMREPPHLTGLTAWDLSAAMMDLRTAATKKRAADQDDARNQETAA